MRRMGDAPAHALSSVTLAIAIIVLVWFSIGWMAPATVTDAWAIGGLWLGLTLAFEFLAGHYLFGTPWRELLADYDVLRGRLWVLVLIATLVSPPLMARTRLFQARVDRQVNGSVQ
jgi:hypothetical protein